jgi:integral membrane protein
MKQKYFQSPIGRLRIIAFLEGVSFLILLGIAMPLKYMAGMPEAVKIVGMAHGVFFIAFIFSLIDVKISTRMGFGKIILAFIASLLPFGTFVLDAKLLKKEMDAEKS